MKNYFSTLLLAAMIFVPFTAGAQVTIGSGEAPHSFSVLELTGGGTQGLRLPQMSEGDRDDMVLTQAFQDEKTGLAVGLMIFNTSSSCVEFWDGSDWVLLCESVAASY